MIKVATLAILLCLHPVTFAANDRISCQSQATNDRSATATAFLRLTQAGVNLMHINVSDLEWAESSDIPVSPLRNGKSIYSLFLQQAMSELLPKIMPDEWMKLKQALGTLRKNKSQDQEQIDTAQDTTAPIYHWTKLPFHPSKVVVAQYVAKNGDVFVVSQDDFETEVAEIHTAKTYTFKFWSPVGSYTDFFETKSGQVLMATLTDASLRVIDIHTGSSLLNLKLSHLKHFAGHNLDQYRALLFESGKDLKALVGPRGNHSHNEKPIPIAVVDVKSGDVSPRRLPARAVLHSERLENGHVYCFGTGMDSTDSLNTIYIVDITANHYLLRRVQRVPQPRLTLGAQHLFLNAAGQPEMIFHQHQSREVYSFDKAQNRAVKILDVDPEERNPLFFRDSDGKMKMITVGRSGTFEFKVTIAPLDGTKPSEYEVRGHHPEHFYSTNALLATPRGFVLVLIETGEAGNREYVTFMELSSGGTHTIPTTASFLEKVFYNPRDGRILGFANEVGRHAAEYHLFQLLGKID